MLAARGLTRAQAAAQLFVSKSTIAAWLKPATSKSSNPVPQWALEMLELQALWDELNPPTHHA
jgi:hypothetical protein